jgi:hypothetical protein
MRALVALVLCSCSTVWQAGFAPPTEVARVQAPFLKAHLRDGGVVVLERWRVLGESLAGDGLRYDAARSVVTEGPVTVPLAEVALLESNEPRRVWHTGLLVLAGLTAASAGLAGYCLSELGTCF